MIHGIIKEWTDFIKRYGTKINLLLMKDIIKNYIIKDWKIIIFINFCSAYNTVEKDRLYNLMSMNNSLPEEEKWFFCKQYTDWSHI